MGAFHHPAPRLEPGCPLDRLCPRPELRMVEGSFAWLEKCLPTCEELAIVEAQYQAMPWGAAFMVLILKRLDPASYYNDACIGIDGVRWLFAKSLTTALPGIVVVILEPIHPVMSDKGTCEMKEADVVHCQRTRTRFSQLWGTTRAGLRSTRLPA